MTTNGRRSPLEQLNIFSDVTKTFFVISGFVLLGLALIWWNVEVNRLTAIIWSLACLSSGGIIGFLFGIPRVLQDNPPVAVNNAAKPVAVAGGAAAVDDANKDDANKTPTAYRIMVNTNLEQISDWLTKIIVGLGLIELRNVPGYLNNLSGYFALGLGGTPQTQSLASAVIVYFVIVGFLGVYLMTRIYLAQVFSRADRETQETAKLERARLTLEEAKEQFSKEVEIVKDVLRNR